MAENSTSIQYDVFDKNRSLTDSSVFRLLFTLLIDCSVVIHIFFILLFASLDIKFMVCFNIVSSAVYIFIRLFIRHGHYTFISLIVYFEILTHSILALFFTGWESGFGLYLISLVPIAYFCPFSNKNTPHICAGFSCLMFFTARIFSGFYPTDFVDYNANFFIRNIYIFNSAVCFSTLFTYTISFTTSLNAVQQGLNKRNAVLRELACIDPLTGLMNRRVMYEFLSNIRTSDKPCMFSVAIADIDGFKYINDTYGHDCGDYVLKELSSIISSYGDDDILICRWGGEEFLFLFTGNSSGLSVCIAERACKDISQKNFIYNDVSIKVTVTLGVSSSDECTDIDKAVVSADKNLYYGKSHGKNCVITGDSIIENSNCRTPSEVTC